MMRYKATHERRMAGFKESLNHLNTADDPMTGFIPVTEENMKAALKIADGLKDESNKDARISIYQRAFEAALG